MDSVAKLREVLRKEIAAMTPPTVVWATCKSVNANEGTMTAERDDVDYLDVLIGLNGNQSIPKVDSKVLLGIIEGKRPVTLLLMCDTEELHLNGKNHGGLVKADTVAERLNTLEQDLNTLKLVLSTWVPVSQDGGAALKAAAGAWYGQQLTTTTSQQLQNSKVKHG